MPLLGFCNTAQFSCKNGECVDYEMKCDREYDCKDESDESHCSKCVSKYIHSLTAFDYICSVTNFIISQISFISVCNSTTEFRCASGPCIKKEFKCDGGKDCTDGSDEICGNLCVGNKNYFFIQPRSTKYII